MTYDLLPSFFGGGEGEVTTFSMKLKFKVKAYSVKMSVTMIPRLDIKRLPVAWLKYSEPKSSSFIVVMRCRFSGNDMF